MNLRLEAILKKEKNLYKDITGNLKGKNFAELNGGLAETIAKLLERKALIEQLNQEVLADEAREALYQRIEDNNKYFAEEIDRADINNQFMQADDSYAKSAEWQNLHMAFLSTASVSSYKAVDKFNNNFENLKKRKEEIDKALEQTNKSKAKAMAIDHTTTVDNAKEQWEKYKAEKDKLTETYNKKEEPYGKIQLANQSGERKYLSSKDSYESRKIAKASLPKLSEDMKKDPECVKFLPPEHFEKLINEQKDVLKENEEARAAAIANASAEYKSYFEETYTKEEAEKLALLNGFKKYLDAFISDDSDKIKEVCGTSGINTASTLESITTELGKSANPSIRNFKKIQAAETELKAMIDAFDKLHREFDPEYYKKSLYEQEDVYHFTAAEANKIVSKMIKQINNQLDKRKDEIFNNLNDKEKDLITPSEETKKAEKDINDKIAKLETAKNRAIEMRKSDAAFNREFNTFINRKIKEGGYKIPTIAPEDMEKVKGDEYLKEKIDSDLVKYKQEMDANQNAYDKVEKAKAELAPIKAERAKNAKELNDKIEHARQMMKPKIHFNFHKYEEALNTHCKDVPKLDVQAVMEEKRVSGNDLLQMVDAYKGNHKNSPEFDAMVSSMLYVVNWGTPMALPTTYRNAPKTFEQAIDQLKANCKKYEEAKKEQHRPFPSKMRHLRLQMVKAFDMYADTQKESLKDFKTSEKVANSWNDYFASRGETPILDEENKDLVKENNQIKEPVLEKEDELGGF